MSKLSQVYLETGVFIAIVAAAFIAMAGYLKGAIQGGWKSNADSISVEQYEEEQSIENLAIKIKNPKMTVTKTDGTPLRRFNLTNTSGIQEVSGWGVYDE
jgi:Flp pilus assembly pilin Flp